MWRTTFSSAHMRALSSKSDKLWPRKIVRGVVKMGTPAPPMGAKPFAAYSSTHKLSLATVEHQWNDNLFFVIQVTSEQFHDAVARSGKCHTDPF